MHRPREISFGTTSNNSSSSNRSNVGDGNSRDESCVTSTNNNNTVNTNRNSGHNTTRWISRCSSLSAREAMTILTQSYDVTSMIPGPFVVMQGVPGDGMANTIDSMPELIFGHRSDDDGTSTDFNASGSSSPNYAGSNIFGNNAASIFRGNHHSPTQRTGSAGNNNMNHSGSSDNGTNESSNISIPSDLPNEIPHLSSGSMNSSQTSRFDTNEGDCVNILPGQGGGEGSIQNEFKDDEEKERSGGDTSDGEVVCMMGESMTSDVSSLEMVHVDPITTTGENDAMKIQQQGLSTPRMSNMNSNEYQNRLQKDRGIHLPLPPSAVSLAAIGMGYNSFIPSVGTSKSKDSIGGTSMIQRQNLERSKNQNSTSNHIIADSFILIDDTNNGDDETNQKSGIEESKMPTEFFSSQENNYYEEEESLQTNTSNIDIGRTTSCKNNPKYSKISAIDKKAIQQWKHSCRENEHKCRKDMIEDASMSPSNHQSHLVQDQWWITKSGCLAVFETMPILSTSKTEATIREVDHNDQNAISTSLGNQIQFGNVVGEISPGCTVMATEIHCLDEKLLHKKDSEVDDMLSNRTTYVSKYEVLKIESPFIGYVIYSFNGYCYLGPGLPMYYVEPEVWMWRVMCTNGAFVRQGIELTSVHTETAPFGSIVRATRKTINSMGLSRVLIESSLPNVPQNNDDKGVEGVGIVARLRNIGSFNSNELPESRRFCGWVSEALNPLSGQRGKIVQPIPFPVPALYRVTLTDGAVIRSGIELSSPQIGHAPIGSMLTVVGRAYSEHPADRCLERLKLAGSGGWISVRLNRSPPRDYLVVELVGIDGRFDPNEAGLYHIERQRQVLQECYNNNKSSQNDSETKNMENLRQSLNRLSSISSINDDEEDQQGGNLANSGELTCSSLTSTAVPTLYRSGVAGGSVASQSVKACGSKAQKDEHCLICLTEQRSATIVHGETGHIACCLACARILKARGDKCPVCRLPIDSIIQQFWA